MPTPSDPQTIVNDTVEAVAGLWAALLNVQEACHTDRILVSPRCERRLSAAEAVGPSSRLQVRAPRDLIGHLSAASAGGARVAGLTCGTDLLEAHASLDEAVRVRSPFLLVHATGPSRDGFDPGYDSVFKVLDAGALVLAPSSHQELLDFSLIARRTAELSVAPVLLMQDLAADASIVGTVTRPDAEAVRDYLGSADDTVDSPTPAQRMLFGDRRRRIVRLLDLAHPLAVGMQRSVDWEHRADAGDRPFFEAHLPDLLDQAMAEFGLLMGRHYERADGHGLERSDTVVVTFGVAGDVVRRATELAGGGSGMRVGHLHLNVLSPFPSDIVTKVLAGKRHVLVLERCAGGEFGAPLSAMLRESLQRAAENGLAESDDLPHPDCAAWPRGASMPGVTSAVLEASSPGDVEAVRELVLKAGEQQSQRVGRRRFFAGVSPGETTSRLPVLEQLRQRLTRAYPGILAYASPAPGRRSSDVGRSRMVIAGLDPTRSALAGAAIARAMGTLEGARIRTYWRSGDARRPSYVVEYDFATARGVPSSLCFAMDPGVLAGDAVADEIRPGTVLLIAQRPGASTDLEASCSQKLLATLRHLDTRVLAFTDDSADRSEAADPDGRDADDRRLRVMLAALPGMSESERSLILEALRSSGEATETEDALPPVSEVPVPGETDRGAVQTAEPEPPRLVRDSGESSGNVYDLSEFWRRVGYVSAIGHPEQVVSDPQLSSGWLPGGSGSIQHVRARPERVPGFVAENCTACGACWTYCPECAFAVRIRDSSGLVAEALAVARDRRHDTSALERYEKHLAREVHRVATADELGQFRTAGALLRQAFDQLAARIEEGGGNTDGLREIVESAGLALDDVAVARPPSLFADRDSARSGSGLMMSLAANPGACTGCGICAGVCSDDALEMQPAGDALLAGNRAAWNHIMTSPGIPAATADELAGGTDAVRGAWQLAERGPANVLLGGAAGPAGSGTRMTLRFVFGMIEARAVRRLERLDVMLRETDESLQKAIAETVAEPLRLNDFEAFARRLKAAEEEFLTAESIAALLDDGDTAVDRLRLSRLSDLLEEVRAHGTSIREASKGFGRYRCVVVVASDRLGASFPNNPLVYPWLNVVGGGAVGATEGIFSGIVDEVGRIFDSLRRARQVLAGGEPDDAHALSYHEWSDDEWALCPPVVAVLDRDSVSLEALLASEFPVKVLLLDDPGVTREDGDRALLALAEPDLFLLRASITEPDHLWAGLDAGLSSRRPALFHMLVAEPDASGTETSSTLELMRSAVRTRVFPLCRYDPDGGDAWLERWSLDGNPDPGRDWSVDGAGDDDAVEVTPADWTLIQDRFRRDLRHVPRASWTSDMVPVAEFIGLSADDRVGRLPYVEITRDGRQIRFSVTDNVVAFAIHRLRLWQLLQEVCGLRPGVSESFRSETRRKLEHEFSEREQDLNAALTQQMAAAEEVADSQYVGRLAARLLALSGFAPGTAGGDRSIRETGSADTPPGTNGNGRAQDDHSGPAEDL